MDIIIQLSIALLCLFFVWRIYKLLKKYPELLSKENLSKSASTIGVLALILIGGIALMILLLRAAS